MSEQEESLAGELAPSGSLAWQRLHGDVSSQLMVDVRRSTAAPSGCRWRSRAGSRPIPTRPRRRAAYEGELEAWATVAVPLAAALNGAKGELGVLNRRRGFADDLEPALRANNVDRATLDAMTDAVVASLPSFRRYLRAKARLLGHAGGLPWWDLFAPVGRAERGRRGRARPTACATRSPATRPISRRWPNRAFAEQWVDAETRDGKQGGAYCAGVEGDVSRIMMNFDGSQDSSRRSRTSSATRSTTSRSAERTPLQRRLPMALAETASIFCETLLFEHAAEQAGDDGERLALLDVHLVGATQTVVDIHSRFLFETELCARRRRTTLSVADLKTAMLDAQEAAYGDGLDPDAPPRVHVGGEGPLLHAVLQLAVHVRPAVRHRPVRALRRRSRAVPRRLRRPALDGRHGRRRDARRPVRLRRARRATSGPRASRCSSRHIDDYERLAPRRSLVTARARERRAACASAVVVVLVVGGSSRSRRRRAPRRAWTVVPTAAGAAYGHLAAVSCPTPTTCFAVGTQDTSAPA